MVPDHHHDKPPVWFDRTKDRLTSKNRFPIISFNPREMESKSIISVDSLNTVKVLQSLSLG